MLSPSLANFFQGRSFFSRKLLVVDARTEVFVQDLSEEAVFDSQGEFQVDLARAREKLEQHLGVWPEDYLAFLIQGAYAL